MTPQPNPLRLWRKQKNGTFSPAGKAPATLKLTLPCDMLSPDKPWMDRIQTIERPAYIPPIRPMPIVWELQHNNNSLRSSKSEEIAFRHLGTAPVPVKDNTGDMKTLQQNHASNLLRQTPEWSAKKVLAARATSVFLEKQQWLWGKFDGSSCAAKRQALIVDITWACKEMDRRNQEFFDEVEVLEQTRIMEGMEEGEREICN
ncbi:hypothetical protein TI39_contig272g00013 [Zymoseptoria brevis]|uniref:Uncharacterized protein n=1 Tax=Zymoseptoria brevis TaxID=1047168 RepID=A0A0F4H0C3_9PEZI|nr:hypothetical protein TI39_contig272g00013 [Zymoseptoria brevis]